MRVLVVGGGGREHALCWALHADDPSTTLFAAPGNPGSGDLRIFLRRMALAPDATSVNIARVDGSGSPLRVLAIAPA